MLIVLFWICCFYIKQLGDLDPYHVIPPPERWKNLAKSAGVTLALLFIAAGAPEKWVPFLIAFILAQTVAVAFKFPNIFRYDYDEETGLIQRLWDQYKVSYTDAGIAKGVSLLLAFLLVYYIGDWWFVVFIACGIFLILGKGGTARLMDRSDTCALIVGRGTAAYVLGCSVFGFVLFQSAGLQSDNWMDWTSWAGLLVGATVDAS